MPIPFSRLLVPIIACSALSATAASRIGTGAVQELYEQKCGACHGMKMESGIGGSLIDDTWKHGSSDEAIAKVIRDGAPGTEMIAFKEQLSEEQIRALVILIRERQQMTEPAVTSSSEVITAGDLRLQLQPLMTSDSLLWGMTVLPDQSMLVTQRSGKLWHYQNGNKQSISGVPEVWHQGQGGLLDVAAHPDYASNGWIYLAFSETSGKKNNQGRQVGATKIIRAKLKNNALVEQQMIFSVPLNEQVNRGWHFGCRLVLVDGYLFFGIGDAGFPENAQKLDNVNGKIHRLHDDGRVPNDNPFVNDKDAIKSIWTYGNRNPQGLTYDAQRKILWEAEHGPRGGDEINVIEKGKNYGWPAITYGINYDGTPITDKTAAPGMEQPKHYWTPSIAVSNIDIYRGDRFKPWQGKMLVSSLAAQELRLLDIEAGQITGDTLLFNDRGRIRDVQIGLNGEVFLLINNEQEQKFGLYSLKAIK